MKAIGRAAKSLGGKIYDHKSQILVDAMSAAVGFDIGLGYSVVKSSTRRIGSSLRNVIHDESGHFDPILIGYGSGRDVRPMEVVRQIEKGEKIDDIIREVSELTYINDVEHAVVSMNDGRRTIVSGGLEGIEFRKGQIKRIIGHTHPYSLKVTGPSGPDINALYEFGQISSYLLEHGELIKFWRSSK